MSNSQDIQAYVARWQASGAAERANFPQFAVELCEVLASLGHLPAGRSTASSL